METFTEVESLSSNVVQVFNLSSNFLGGTDWSSYPKYGYLCVG